MPMTSAQGIERERKRTAARMAQKRAEREAAEREAKLAAQGKAGDDLQVTRADTQGEDSQPGAALEVGAGKVPFWQLSPAWQASQARKAGEAAAGLPVPVGAKPANNVEAAQTLALDALAIYAVRAAHYVGRVATKRAKGEQWALRAAMDVLDRIGANAEAVERARERAAGAGGAALAPLLARLAQAQALAARKATATDAETGQTSGTPGAD